MIEDGHVRQVLAAFDLHADVEPHRALALGARVALACGIDDLTADPLAPRHAQKQAAVVVLANRDVGLRLAPPFEIEDESSGRPGGGYFAKRPALGLGEDGAAGLVEQVVTRLPPHVVFRRRSAAFTDRRRGATPVLLARVVKVITPVDTGEAPEKTGLMFVMRGTELRDHASSVRSRDRMQIGAAVGRGVLYEDRFGSPRPEDGDGARSLVVPDRQSRSRR